MWVDFARIPADPSDKQAIADKMEKSKGSLTTEPVYESARPDQRCLTRLHVPTLIGPEPPPPYLALFERRQHWPLPERLSNKHKQLLSGTDANF